MKNFWCLPLLAVACMVSLPTLAQVRSGGSVRGQVTDSTGKQNLAQASVTILSSTDSSIRHFAVTDNEGFFQIRNLSAGNYRLVVSFEGFEPIKKRFSITASSTTVDFGNLNMQRKSEELAEVVVERPPISVKKDTVEYSAELFTTKPNAVAEDLLKKLPGVQVDKSGNITAQGETVTRVMVNGKRFFNDDPKLATRNLPPDIIDKIQVFDDLSDQSKFTGFDDGNRVKTINIITKKNAQHGYFGRLIAGVGTDQDYDFSANMHRFDGNQQISLLGEGNDINKQNFTIQDILGTSGGRRGGGGGNTGSTNQFSPGVTTVWAGGANYRDSWGPKVDAYGSYFYNSQHVETDQQSLTRNILTPDSTIFNDQIQSNIQRTQNNRIYFNLEDRFDSSNSLIFRPNITFQTTSPNSVSTTSTTQSDGAPIINSSNLGYGTNSGFNVNGSNLQFRHKFAKKYRTISLDLNMGANYNNGDGYTYNINNFYTPSVPVNKSDTINQYYNDSLHSISFSPTLSYTEPVGKNQIIELKYNYAYNWNRSINNTYAYSEAEKAYSYFDSLYSNSYKFTSTANQFTVSWRIQDAKYNLSVGSGIQYTDLNSLNTTKNVTVAQNYLNFTPTVNFQYQFTPTQHFRLNYSGRTGTPSVAQLQPVVTTSDSVNFQVGNPSLKPQFTHSLRMLYASFDPSTQRAIFATLNASAIINDIQNAIITQPSGQRISTYVNLGGTFNVAGYFNYGFALKKPKSNLNFITNISYSQSQNLIGDSAQAAQNALAHDYSRNTAIAETISWTTNLKKNFDMNFSAASTYNIVRNSLQPKENLNYFTEVLSTEFTAYTNSGWLVAANFDYNYSGTQAPGYTASAPIVSPSIAKLLFKKKNGEVRLSVFDLLNKNAYVSQSSSTNQITYSKTNVLARYAMLTLTFNLGKFPAQQQRRQPGMYNMYRPGGGPGGNFPPGGGKRP
jgi:Outer membrane protein beta-barrel family/Carboxypeptidase regulatory-like domain